MGVLLVGDTCEEHVFSGEAGKALLKVDSLGDQDSYVTPSGHVGGSRVSVKYRLEVGSEGDVFFTKTQALSYQKVRQPL